jgi:S1-C subfamily serine protease
VHLNFINCNLYFIYSFSSGDIIVEVNGKKVTGVRDVLDVIGLDVGKIIEFKLVRGQDQEFLTRLTTAPEGKGK